MAAGFAITTAPVPDLDRTNLVVGRIVSGAALVDDLAAMPAVKATSGNPFFKCALGDDGQYRGGSAAWQCPCHR